MTADAAFRFPINGPPSQQPPPRVSAIADIGVQLGLAAARISRKARPHLFALHSRHLPIGSVPRLIQFWHETLGHISMDTMIAIANHNSIEGFTLTAAQIRSHWTDCVSCLRGKMCEAPTSAKSTSAPPTSVGQSIQVDVYGNFKIPSVGNNRYLFNFIDRFCGYVYTYFAATKSEVTTKDAITACHAHYALHNHPIHEITGDADPILTPAAITDHCTSLHIQHRFTSPFHHEGVGVVEAFHRTLGNRVTAAYDAAPWMPKSLWSYACALVALQYNFIPNNKCPTSSAYEMFTTKRPNVNMRLVHPWKC